MNDPIITLADSFIKWANPALFFVYFRPLLITISIIQIETSIDGVHGIQTCGHRKVDADDTTELIVNNEMETLSKTNYSSSKKQESLKL